jgi:hypothetical protein
MPTEMVIGSLRPSGPSGRSGPSAWAFRAPFRSASARRIAFSIEALGGMIVNSSPP